MKPAPFTWEPVTTVDEAVGALAADEDATLIAGGQSLMPLLALRLARPTVLVDLAAAGLDGLSEAADHLAIGAMVTQRRLELDPVVRARAPLLAGAAAHVGFAATRNRGTLGGSLAHADPVAELPAVAVALGATIAVAGPGGRRSVPAAALADGFFSTTLARAEVITSIGVPAAGPRHGAAWCEWSPRQHDFPDAGVGVAVELDARGEARWVGAAACGVGTRPLALGAVVAGAGVTGAAAPDPPLLRSVAAAVAAAASAAGATGERNELCGLLAARALAQAWGRAGRAAP